MFSFEQGNTLKYLTKSNYNYTAGKKDRANKNTNSIGNVENAGNPTDKLNLLKTLVVSSDNVELIKTILSETAQHREKMIKDASLEFLEHFPMFFTHPEFVSFD